MTGVVNNTRYPSLTFPGESLQTSPQQATFGTPVQNPNIPDLKAVMFPSDNPFAYGNQPISTLEGTQSEMDSQSPFNSGDTFMTSGPPMNTNVSYESYYNTPVSYTQSANPLPSGPSMEAPNYQTMNAMDAPLASPDIDTMPTFSEANFWQQMNGGGRAASAAGLPPGVNFGDLFGNEHMQPGWLQSGYHQR